MPYSSPHSGFFGMHLPADQAKKKPQVVHSKARPMTSAMRSTWRVLLALSFHSHMRMLLNAAPRRPATPAQSAEQQAYNTVQAACASQLLPCPGQGG